MEVSRVRSEQAVRLGVVEPLGQRDNRTRMRVGRILLIHVVNRIQKERRVSPRNGSR